MINYRISFEKLFVIFLSIIYFLIFSGRYALILGFLNFTSVPSRQFSIALILILNTLLAINFILSNRRINNPIQILFLIFILLYYLRIFLEFLKGSNNYHIPIIDFLLYFSSFVAIPFVLIANTNLDQRHYRIILWSIMMGSFFLNLQSLIFFKQFIGQVGRLNNRVTENAISPTILGYNAALTISIIFFYLRKTFEKKVKIFLIVIAISSLVPLFLGSSRGALLVLLISLILKIGMTRISLYRKLLILLIPVPLFIVSANFFAPTLINRFKLIFEKLEAGNYSDDRIILWKNSIIQIANNPIFGNSLENEYFNRYPHNFLIEVMISTGVIGGLVIMLFLILSIKKSLIIIKTDPNNSFLGILFLISFISALFSGGIYNSLWLAASSALLISYKKIR